MDSLDGMLARAPGFFNRPMVTCWLWVWASSLCMVHYQPPSNHYINYSWAVHDEALGSHINNPHLGTNTFKNRDSALHAQDSRFILRDHCCWVGARVHVFVFSCQMVCDQCLCIWQIKSLQIPPRPTLVYCIVEWHYVEPFYCSKVNHGTTTIMAPCAHLTHFPEGSGMLHNSSSLKHKGHKANACAQNRCPQQLKDHAFFDIFRWLQVSWWRSH